MKLGNKSATQLMKQYGEFSSESLSLLGKELSVQWDTLHTKLLDFVKEQGYKNHPHYLFLIEYLYHDGNSAWARTNSYVSLQDFKTQKGEEKLWQELMWKAIIDLRDFISIAEYVMEKEGIDID